MCTSTEAEVASSVPGLIPKSPGGFKRAATDESVEIEKLWTPDEVAMFIDVKASWVMDHVTRIEPIIPHIRIGKMIRFKRQAVMDWLDSMVSTKATWE